MLTDRNKKTRSIRSDKIMFRNSQGHNIVGFYDQLIHRLNGKNDIVVIPPAYGEIKRDHISLSYYLVKNGFNVIRYDNTFHLGESDGDIIDADLKNIQNDLVATLNYVENKYGKKERVIIVASSLAGRVALKVSTFDKRIGLLVTLVGVVNFQKTMASIYREDIVDQYKAGKRRGLIDIFGHEIKDTFIANAIDGNYHNLDSTLADARKVTIPTVFFAASDDLWISLDEVKSVVTNIKSIKAKLNIIPGAMHQLQENPRLAKQVICEITRECMDYSHGEDKTAETVIEPNIHDIVSQNKIELDHLRGLSTITNKDEMDFWKKYLQKFSVILQSPDYQELMHKIESFLGLIRESDIILDAGCGNGHFSTWILKGILEEKCKRTGVTGIRFLSLDFVQNAVVKAENMHRQMMKETLQKEVKCKFLKTWKFSYTIGNLNNELPFRNEQFDKICCNLVVSYLDKPELCLQELTRVLKSGGKIVVSSLKPYCDLSLIYRNFAEMAQDSHLLLEEARALLSSTGKIKEKEGEGHYHFYTESELKKLLSVCGLKNISIERALGNQVNVAVGEK